jgi:DNA-binding CsgD family transcriptional regulator
MSKRRTDSSPGPAVPLAAIERALGLSVGVARDRHGRLTRRQAQVAALVATGRPNREIAEELGISPKRLDSHRTAVMRKLQVRTAAGVANVVNVLRLAQAAEAAGR